MNDKYIIKNCPAILRMTKVCDAYETTRDLPQLCKDRTDCVLKQIVELCKNIKKDHYWGMREIKFSQEILKLLDIQEVE